MVSIMKMSKYNLTAYDQEGNLVLYNFLVGLPSLTKAMKPDVDKFTQVFLTNAEIHSTSCEGCVDAVESLLNSGILVAADTDESVTHDALHYKEAYDSKLNLTIYPTGKCNCRCPYCFEATKPFPREAMSEDAQSAMIKFVQRQIPSCTALHIYWFGGEPLLETEMIKYLSEKFMQICKVRFIPYSSEITTNGVLLDADMFAMLYKLKVYKYMITLDGFKEQHDKKRFLCGGTGTYDTIMTNLLNIRDSKQYKFAHIVLRINVTKDMLDGLNDFIQLIADLFSDDPRFQIIFVPVADFSISKNLDSAELVSPEELALCLHSNEIYMNKILSKVSETEMITPVEKCKASKKHAYTIVSDLSVYKCHVHFDYPANKMGHINSKGDLVIDEALNRKWYMAKKIPESCNECFYLPSCNSVNPSCPIRYHGGTSVGSCLIENGADKNILIEKVLYATDYFPYHSLVL